MQDEEVDKRGEEPFGQVWDLVLVQVQVGEIRQVIEGSWLYDTDLVVSKIEVDQALEPPEGSG